MFKQKPHHRSAMAAATRAEAVELTCWTQRERDPPTPTWAASQREPPGGSGSGGAWDELELEQEWVWEKVEVANGHVCRSISPETAEVLRRMVLPSESTSFVPRRCLLRAREPEQFAAMWCLPSGTTSSVPRRRPPRRPNRARNPSRAHRRCSQGRAHDLAPRSA